MHGWLLLIEFLQLLLGLESMQLPFGVFLKFSQHPFLDLFWDLRACCHTASTLPCKMCFATRRAIPCLPQVVTIFTLPVLSCFCSPCGSRKGEVLLQKPNAPRSHVLRKQHLKPACPCFEAIASTHAAYIVQAATIGSGKHRASAFAHTTSEFLHSAPCPIDG